MNFSPAAEASQVFIFTRIICHFSGHSMYVDIASNGENKIAHMVTPGIGAVSDTYCTTFWVYISDSRAGTLTVRYLDVLLI